MERLFVSHKQSSRSKTNSSAEGFALLSLIALIPLVVTLLACLGGYFHILKRKSLAQGICVQTAARLQQDLKKPLVELLKLNPHASALRIRRTAADKALTEAMISGVAPLIATAQANQTAVILQQSTLHARQLALLSEAQRLRDQGVREINRRARLLLAENISAKTFYHLPLAVEETPRGSPSPNYEPIAMFAVGQQQVFRFQLNLIAEFPQIEQALDTIQKTECSVTLEQKEEKWEVRTLAAKAS